MQSNWIKYTITVVLLVIYINRGLFVAMPGMELSSTHYGSSNEINSLLEVILNFVGCENNIDEDGDTPESYDAAKTLQPLIDHDMYACMTCPHATVRKTFYLSNEAMPSLHIYRNIDHPPEQLTIDNG